MGGLLQTQTGQALLANFLPLAIGTIAVTNSSGTLDLTGGIGTAFEFKNVGTAEVFVNLGTAAVASAGTTGLNTCLSIPAGAILVYNFPNATPNAKVAAVTASGSAVLRVAQGTGS